MTGTAGAEGVLGRELRSPRMLRGWPQANRAADRREGRRGAHAGGWVSGGGRSKGYWGGAEGVCCDRG